MKFYFHVTFLFCFAILHKKGRVENKKNVFPSSRSAKLEVKQISDRNCFNSKRTLL